VADQEPKTVQIPMPQAIAELLAILNNVDPHITVRPKTPQEVLQAIMNEVHGVKGYRLTQEQKLACLAWALDGRFASEIQAVVHAQKEAPPPPVPVVPPCPVTTKPGGLFGSRRVQCEFPAGDENHPVNMAGEVVHQGQGPTPQSELHRWTEGPRRPPEPPCPPPRCKARSKGRICLLPEGHIPRGHTYGTKVKRQG
jgi:hypothetical protein